MVIEIRTDKDAMTIRLPRQIKPYPDRDLDCQQALEDTFKTIIGLADRAGWQKKETAVALQELAFGYLSMEEANTQTELAILQAQLGQTKH
jgi:hypothetical protein